MPETKINFVDEVLAFLHGVSELAPQPFESPYAHIKRIRRWDPDSYYHTVWSLQKRGLIKIIKKQNQKFIKLTQKGELGALIAKMRYGAKKPWDKKWRIFIFDIPENSRKKRDILRRLLKQQGFIKLQASVFVNPFPINQDGIEYLRKSGLMSYIRIFRVDAMDNDKDLREHFKL
jgi:CRISPR-associated endonuclease Cas2